MAEFDNVNLDLGLPMASAELADLIDAVEKSEMEMAQSDPPPFDPPQQDPPDSDSVLAEIFPDLFSFNAAPSADFSSAGAESAEDFFPQSFTSFNTVEQIPDATYVTIEVPVVNVPHISVPESVPTAVTPVRKTRTSSKSSDEGIGMSPGYSYVDELEVSSPDQIVTDDKDETCKVCLEKAGKHSYYGGRVCPSCRAFFRRAVQSKYYEIFFCTKGENCVINLKTRRSCQYCRFKKCLDAGMRISWVLPESERNRRFNKLAKVQQRNRLGDQQKAVVPLTKQPIMPVTTEEMLQIEKTNDCINGLSCDGLKEYLLTHPNFMKELATVAYFGGKINFEFYKNFNNMSNKIMEESFRIVDEFKELPWSDKQKLVEVNGAVINRFKSSIFMDDDNSCLSKGIDSFTKSGNIPVLEEINHKLKAMHLEDKKPVLTYNQFYGCIWNKKEDEERHRELMSKMRSWPRDNASAQPDDIQITLLRMIMAFNTDFVNLQRPDIVSKAQLRFTFLLQKHLKSKYGVHEANKRFINGIMMISYAREAVDIMDRMIKERCHNGNCCSPPTITEISCAQ